MKKLVTVVLLCFSVGLTVLGKDGHWYDYRVVDGGAHITGHNVRSGDSVDFPATLGGYPVTGVADNLFQNIRIIGIDLPSTVERIGSHAFDNCGTSLRITLPPNIKEVGDYAFVGCQNLRIANDRLPESLEKIGEGAFSRVGKARLVIPGTVKRIPAKMCYYCLQVASVEDATLDQAVLEEGIASIGQEAFARNDLKTIVIPASVTNVAPDFVDFCSKMTNITVAAGNPVYISHGGSLFTRDGTLLKTPAKAKTVTIPEGTKQIGTLIDSWGTNNGYHENAFYKVAHGWAMRESVDLEEIVIPKSVVRIADAVLPSKGCLKRLTIPFTGHKREDTRGLACMFECGDDDSLWASCSVPRSLKTVIITDDDDPKLGGCFRWIEELRIESRPGDAPFLKDLWSLKDYDLPTSVTNIPERTFTDCRALPSVHLPAGVKTIGPDAFRGCTAMKTITVDPDNRWFKVKDGALYTADFKELVYVPQMRSTPLEIPYGVVRVRAGAVSDCTSLPEVVLPLTLCEIGAEAFLNCTSLTSIRIPARVTTIGDSAFSGCTKVTSIVLPDSVEVIGSSAFRACQGDFYEMPKHLRSIGDYAFCGNRLLTRLKFSEGLESIGTEAFYSTPALATVELPSTIRHVGSNAFGNQYRGVVGTCYLSPASSETKIVVPEGVTVIADGAFARTSVQEVSFPESVKSIGSYVFSEAYALTSVKMPSKLDMLGECAFKNSGLRELKLPDGLSAVPEYLCYECYELTNVVLSSSVTRIDYRAFSKCWKLATITIPSALNHIGGEAFLSCGKLKSFVTGRSLPPGEHEPGEIESNAFRGTVLADFDVAGPLKRIRGDQGAFARVVLPDGLEELQGNCLLSATAEEIVIPASVKRIERDAFRGSKLRRLVFLGNAPEDLASDFVKSDQYASRVTICVSRSSKGWGVPIPGTWCGLRIEYIDDIPLKPGEYAVSFNVNGGAAIATQAWEKGRVYRLPVCTKRYAEHVGWYGVDRRRYDPEALVFDLDKSGGVVRFEAIWK